MKRLFQIFLSFLCLIGISTSFAEEPDTTTKQNKNIYFAYRSFWPEHETMKKFIDCGVNTICIFPASTENSLGEPYSKYPKIWRFNETYDWESLDRQFDEIIAIDPRVEFLCMVDLNTPNWLYQQLSRGGDGPFDTFTSLTNCLANRNWKIATMKYLEDFIHHTEQKYGKRIRAYILACGQTDEWMDNSGWHHSRKKFAAWQAWCKSRALPIPLRVPPFEEFDSATFENVVRDPQREAQIILNAQFCQDLVADSIVEFAKKTKELTNGKKEVGVFFGYILELTGWRLVGCAHLHYEKVFASEQIDFIISPGTYTDRPMGGGSGFMIPNATRLRYGKGFMHEIDHRTTTYNCHLNEFVQIGWMHNWKTQEEDIAGTRREMCLALINHTSCWWFDMWGGAHKTDAAITNIKTMKNIWDRYANDHSPSAAQVLLVVDPQSSERTNDRNPLSKAYRHTRNTLNRLGAPFEVCSFNDLDVIDLSQFRFIIFPATWYITPERQKVLDEKVLRDNRTILWMYAPGLASDKDLDVRRVQLTSGIEFGKNGLNTVKRNGWKSALLHEPDKLTPGMLKELAKGAGVTIYCDDESPVYANKRLVAVHVKDSATKTITLPRKYRQVTELFSGKVVAKDADSFEYQFAGPETALFDCQDEAQ